MNVRKKLITIVLVCVMLFSLSLSVCAGVIDIPENRFYVRHKDECVWDEDRRYIINTDKGYAYLYDSPISDKTVKGYPNGEEFIVFWRYTDKNGEVWGLPQIGSDITGWFRMSELSAVYDGNTFWYEHNDEFSDRSEEVCSIESSQDKPVVIWECPGLKKESAYHYENIVARIGNVYTDENGNDWGYIRNIVQEEGVWVCLNDPYNDDIYVAEASRFAELKAEPIPKDEIPMSDENINLFVIGVFFAGSIAAVATAVTVILFVVKKKRSEANK